MDKVNYNVVLLDESSIDQQVRIYKLAFSLSESNEIIQKKWVKKHYQNPYGSSLIFGVFQNGVLAGMNAFLPSIYEYKGRMVKCLQSCESGVNPDYQGKGIWGTIVKYAVDYIMTQTEYELIFGFPNYQNSYHGFVKMGWLTLSQMKNYILVNNSKNFIKTVSTNKFLADFSFILNILKIGIFFHQLFSKKISISKCDSKELLWNIKPEIMAVKPTIEWADWKKEYRNEDFLKLFYDNRKIGSCIYTTTCFHGQQVVRIDKVSIVDDSPISLKDAFVGIAKWISIQYPNAAFIRTWAMENDYFYERTLKKLLFVKLSHPNPFIVKCDDERYRNALWELSFYDLD